jgi:hypothetical protein
MSLGNMILFSVWLGWGREIRAWQNDRSPELARTVTAKAHLM